MNEEALGRKRHDGYWSPVGPFIGHSAAVDQYGASLCWCDPCWIAPNMQFHTDKEAQQARMN